MEKQLKCITLLSLKEMTLRRVAVMLWSGPDISASISNAGWAYFSDKKWREDIEDKIKDNMLKLKLPELLTKQMIDLVRPISLEVKAWKDRLQFFLWSSSHKEIRLPDSANICWTTSGTINYRKTAEELLRCDKLDVKQRYELACFYCLEDYISLYWEELPDEEKGNYGIQNHSPFPDLPYLWSYILKGERFRCGWNDMWMRNRITLNQFAFVYSAEKGYKTATEYFFQKLTQEEKETSLMRTARNVREDHHSTDRFTMEKHFELLFYLLSVMTPEQQIEIIQAHPIRVFLLFLRWSHRDLFMDNAGLLWTFLPPSRYTNLVGEIIDGYNSSFFYFPKIFEEFFMKSPQDFKKLFVVENSDFDDPPASRFLSAFFRSEDSESIEVMFRNLDAADRVKLVFNRRVFELFYDCMWKDRRVPWDPAPQTAWEDRWHMVEVCLRETSLSKEEKRRLKDAFTRFLERRGLSYRKCIRFFEFLDETNGSSDKRKKGQKRKFKI